MANANKRAWKQIKRSRILWERISHELDTDPGDWVCFIECLDACGFKITKNKWDQKFSDRVFTVIEE